MSWSATSSQAMASKSAKLGRRIMSCAIAETLPTDCADKCRTGIEDCLTVPRVRAADRKLD
jgi:hypothetical protein